MNFGLIGHPLGHSLSPQVHRLLLDFDNDNSTYELFDIPNEDIPMKIPQLLDRLDGFNVTVPHKLAVIPFLKKLDEIAENYGAVNTVICKAAMGTNTDGIGFTRALSAAGIPLNGNVLIIGAGGAARVFAYEAAKAGCSISIMTVNDLRVHELCSEISYKYNIECKGYLYNDLLENYDFSKVDLLLNASPCGMYPHTDICPLPDEKLINIQFCFDAVYNPQETFLVKKVRANGGRAETGLSMLINQAAAAQTLWRGREYTDTEIMQVIEEIKRTNKF